MKSRTGRFARGHKVMVALSTGIIALAALTTATLAQVPEALVPETPVSEAPVPEEPLLAPQPVLPTKIKKPIGQLKADIANVEKAVEQLKTSEEGLAAQRDKIDHIVTRAGKLRSALVPMMDEVSALIKKLGPKPDKNKPAESKAIAATRAQLNKRLTALDGVIKTTKLIEVRSTQLLADIQSKRQALFTRDLLRRSPSPLSSPQRTLVAKNIPELARQFGFMAGAWWQNARDHWLQLLALLITTIAAGYYLRRLSNQSIEHHTAHSEIRPPEFLERIAIIARILPARVLPGLLVLGIVVLGLGAMGLLAPPFGSVMLALAKAVALVIIVMSTARTLLAPVRPRWRLMNLANRTAKPLYWLIVAIAIVFGLDLIVAELARVMFATLPVRIFETFTMSITLALLLIGCALLPYGARDQVVYGQFDEGEIDEGSNGDDTDLFAPISADPEPVSNATAMASADGAPFTPQSGASETYNPRARRWLRLALLAFAAIIIALSLSGYVAFGGFLARQIVLTGTIAFAGILVHLAIRSFVHGHISLAFQPDSPLPPNQRFIDRHKTTLMHGLGLFLNAALVVSLAPWLLLQWGFDGTDIITWMKRAVFGFNLGGVRISVARIAMAIALFFALVFLTRALQRWLDRAVLQRPGVDLGIAHSVRTAVGYGGMTLAALLAISYAGFNITNLAIVAGALSVGIGFGLQSIVNNFVSGLILLAERPIKVGDWISVGNQEGYVRRISVRATEIETFDRASVIVPNSELIAGSVTNMTHRNALGRAVIKVGVGYGEDPERVRDLLLDVAGKTDGVLKFPAPSVSFDDFASSSLDFTLRAYVADVNNKLSIATALRFAIFKAFRDADIEIPYQQHDIHLRDLDSAKQVLAQVIAQRNLKRDAE